MHKTRLWRLRRLHAQVDAELDDFGDRGVEVQYVYNGGQLYRRPYASRAAALADAADKRGELERSGWTAHW